MTLTKAELSESLASHLKIQKGEAKDLVDDVFEEIDDEIQLVKNKGDVIEVYDKYLCTASIEELTAPTIIKSKSKGKEVEKERFDYSLDYKKYLKWFYVLCFLIIAWLAFGSFKQKFKIFQEVVG